MVEGDDEEEDIEALEAKLEALKQKKKDETKAKELAEGMEAAAKRPMVEVQEGFDFTTMSSRKKVAAVQTEAPSELLSEAWKDADAAESNEGGGGLGLPQIVGGVLAALALVVFSQVPVGQSGLDTVTYGGKETRLESADEIRARFERVSGIDDD